MTDAKVRDLTKALIHELMSYIKAAQSDDPDMDPVIKALEQLKPFSRLTVLVDMYAHKGLLELLHRYNLYSSNSVVERLHMLRSFLYKFLQPLEEEGLFSDERVRKPLTLAGWCIVRSAASLALLVCNPKSSKLLMDGHETVTALHVIADHACRFARPLTYQCIAPWVKCTTRTAWSNFMQHACIIGWTADEKDGFAKLARAFHHTRDEEHAFVAKAKDALKKQSRKTSFSDYFFGDDKCADYDTIAFMSVHYFHGIDLTSSLIGRRRKTIQVAAESPKASVKIAKHVDSDSNVSSPSVPSTAHVRSHTLVDADVAKPTFTGKRLQTVVTSPAKDAASDDGDDLVAILNADDTAVTVSSTAAEAFSNDPVASKQTLAQAAKAVSKKTTQQVRANKEKAVAATERRLADADSESSESSEDEEVAPAPTPAEKPTRGKSKASAKAQASAKAKAPAKAKSAEYMDSDSEDPTPISAKRGSNAANKAPVKRSKKAKK